jgi:hypothetical protein
MERTARIAVFADMARGTCSTITKFFVTSQMFTIVRLAKLRNGLSWTSNKRATIRAASIIFMQQPALFQTRCNRSTTDQLRLRLRRAELGHAKVEQKESEMEWAPGSPVSPEIIAHHEAGHAVAGIVLGVAFVEVRIVPGKDGKIGVPLKTNPWRGARPSSNPREFTEKEWSALSQSNEEWERWKKRDHEKYAIFCFAGKAAQLDYAGVVNDEDAKADYSFVEYWLPDYQQRKAALEREATELVRNNWPAVQAVAAKLLERDVLVPAEVEEIFRQTMPNMQLEKSTGA